jgi:hypothetical protein
VTCKKCGKETGPGDIDCPHCGAPQEQGAASGQDLPGVEAPATVHPGAKPKRKWLVPVIAVIGVVVVAAIVLVLVFVVLKGSSPEKTVKQLFTGLENKDIQAIAALVDPEAFKQASGSEAAFKDVMKKNLPEESMKFKDLVFKTSVNGNDATVTVTKGTVTVTDKSGKVSSATMAEAGAQVTFYLVKRDGKWYAGKKTFSDFWVKYDLQAADKSLAKLKSDLDATAGEIDTFFSTLSEGVMSYQGLDEKYKTGSADFVDTLNGLAKKAKATKSMYKSIGEMESAADYKEYAALREQQVDVIIKMVDAYQRDLKEFGDYTANLAANPQTSPATATQGLTAIQNKYAGELQALGAEYNSLDGQAQALKAQLGL